MSIVFLMILLASLSFLGLDFLRVRTKHSRSALMSYSLVDFLSCLFLQISSKPEQNMNRFKSKLSFIYFFQRYKNGRQFSLVAFHYFISNVKRDNFHYKPHSAFYEIDNLGQYLYCIYCIHYKLSRKILVIDYRL